MHIDWFVFSAQIFNFLLLIYLLKRFLYGRIIKAMDDREAKIAARFADAEELKVKANEQAELYEKRNQLLNEAKDQMLNEATMAADAKRKELMEKVRVEVDQVKTRWQDMLVREQDAFFYDLRQRAAKQLYDTARKALRDLADVDLEERIIDEFLRRIKNLLHQQRRQAERGLVKQNEPRPAHQRAADRQHLLLAAGERAAALVAAVAQPRKQREHAFEVGVEAAAVGHSCADLQVLHHRHARKHAAALGRLRDAELGDLVGRQRGDLAAGETDAALAGARTAEHRHHQGRFAGAVGADQRNDLAFIAPRHRRL